MTENQGTLPGLRSELEPGEPVFILRGRDPLAAHIVALWAALRKGDTASAVSIFADTVADPGYDYRAKAIETDSAEKLKSACDKSREIVEWRQNKYLTVYPIYYVD